MNNELRDLIAQQLADLGWLRTQSKTSARKTYNSNIGFKEALIFFGDFNEQGRMLKAHLLSSGENCLEKLHISIPASADADKVKSLVKEFVAQVDDIIKQTPAIFLYNAAFSAPFLQTNSEVDDSDPAEPTEAPR